MIATFCGHAELGDYDAAKQWLDGVLDQLIEAGVRTFYLGGYGAFDELCAFQLRKRSEQLELVLVLPYLDSKMDTRGYDRTVYPPLETVPRRYAIIKRNEWMVRNADIVIAYVNHSWGGAAKTLTYARQCKKRIILYPEYIGTSCLEVVKEVSLS